MVYYLRWVTVSAKVRRDLYEKLKRYRIPVSEVIIRALEEEVRRREEQEVREALERIQEILMKIPPEEIAFIVRRSREES